MCSGAFVACAARLLDGRACTTHWMHADELAALSHGPGDRNVLFVDDGNLITSAGTAAGIDACLHLVRRELGSAVTNVIARRMVVPPQRDGGSVSTSTSRYRCDVRKALPPNSIGSCRTRKAAHRDHVGAAEPSMSARTFARRFVEETGTTPMQWVTDQRVLYARRLLEESDLEVDRVAELRGLRKRDTAAPPFPPHHRRHPLDYRRCCNCRRIRLRSNCI